MTDRWTGQEKLLLSVICGVVFLDTLPQGGTGKIQKTLLREL